MLTLTDAATQTVEQLEIGIYGTWGAGKTSLALTADLPLLLDFDGKSAKARHLGGVPMTGVTRWAEVAEIEPADVAGRKTIVVDTLGAALDVLSTHLMQRDRKLSRGGALTLQGYGLLAAQFRGWVQTLLATGCDVVYVAHGVEEQRAGGDETVDRLLAVGSSKSLVMNRADIFGQLVVDEQGRRWLHFDPVAGAFRKNVGLPSPVRVDDNARLLAELIAQTRQLLGQHAQADAAREQELMDLETVFEAYERAEEFTAAAQEMQDAPPEEKRLLARVAQQRGFAFSKETGAFLKEEL